MIKKTLFWAILGFSCFLGLFIGVDFVKADALCGTGRFCYWEYSATIKNGCATYKDPVTMEFKYCYQDWYDYLSTIDCNDNCWAIWLGLACTDAIACTVEPQGGSARCCASETDAYCGDGTCDGGEECICEADCGPPTGDSCGPPPYVPIFCNPSDIKFYEYDIDLRRPAESKRIDELEMDLGGDSTRLAIYLKWGPGLMSIQFIPDDNSMFQIGETEHYSRFNPDGEEFATPYYGVLVTALKAGTTDVWVNIYVDDGGGTPILSCRNSIPVTVTSDFAIQGKVIIDPNAEAVLGGSGCTLSGTNTGVQPGSNSVVTVPGKTSTLVSVDGSYALDIPGSSREDVALVIGDPDSWSCSCPASCGYTDPFSVVPNSGLNFFVTNSKSAWWQAESGNVHAEGVISSNIPNTATEPYLITGESGLASYGGTIAIGDALGINDNGDNWRAQTSYQGLTTGYAYFARILEDDPNGFSEFNEGKPGINGVYSFSGDTQTSGSWSVSDGESYVILVNGSITITDNITVASGGFLAVIASGDINIDSNVTNIEGIYIADGVINAGTSTSQLVAEGSFTAWQGFELGGRDFNSMSNNTTPVERFVYRPDLVANAYKFLLKPRISWAEVAP